VFSRSLDGEGRPTPGTHLDTTAVNVALAAITGHAVSASWRVMTRQIRAVCSRAGLTSVSSTPGTQ
jgi:hypothetical protein